MIIRRRKTTMEKRAFTFSQLLSKIPFLTFYTTEKLAKPMEVTNQSSVQAQTLHLTSKGLFGGLSIFRKSKIDYRFFNKSMRSLGL